MGTDPPPVMVLFTDMIKKVSIAHGPVLPGKRITYTLEYRNSVAVAIAGVVITDTVPIHSELLPWVGFH